MGHSHIAMTLDTYSYVLPDKKKAAAQKLNSLFEDKQPEKSDTEKSLSNNTETETASSPL